MLDETKQKVDAVAKLPYDWRAVEPLPHLPDRHKQITVVLSIFYKKDKITRKINETNKQECKENAFFSS